MSKKPLNIPVENGQSEKSEVENGHPNLVPPTLCTSSVEEMVQQMKELITENNELKEAMRQRNQAMKERFEELSAWKEKLKDEREFYESKFKEARQCLATKCLENESLHQKLQSLEEKEEKSTTESPVSRKEMSQEVEQLKAQVVKLQAEKADLLAIISELQLKLNAAAAEDSFVEIRMHEGEAVGSLKEHQDVDVKRINGNTALYVRNKSVDETRKCLEKEELTVSQLLHSLRTETQKREALENKMQELKDKCQQSVGSELEVLKLQVSALFRELQETHAKLKEADVIQKKLQEKCQVLEQEHPAGVGDLDEKQQLLYTVKKLELQVESMQAKFNSLQDAYDKLVKELTEALQTVKELKGKEMEVYCSDFHAERAAREKIHEEKEQLATQLAYFLAENQERGDLGRCSLAEMQTRHGTRLPSTQEGAEEQNQPQPPRDIPIHSCPKCSIILPDIDTLQIHVMDCII
ncbi:Optineurin [Ophiophagus hannah]|uniref:Optineurin n=1 Tax=Ophiophagus hannah TaxID=8665 RepID=V8NHC0_OPHHA|nr:Optineurin [Ophiophagus hannah]